MIDTAILVAFEREAEAASLSLCDYDLTYSVSATDDEAAYIVTRVGYDGATGHAIGERYLCPAAGDLELFFSQIWGGGAFVAPMIEMLHGALGDAGGAWIAA